MEKLIKSKCFDFIVRLYSILCCSLISFVFVFLIVFLSKNDINDIILKIQTPVTKQLEMIVISMLFLLLTLVILIPIFLTKKIYISISFSYEDIIIPISKPAKAIFTLVNDSSIILDDSRTLKIENFPDNKINILTSNNNLNSIVVRQYKLNASRKVLSMLNMNSNGIYNFILSVDF